MELMTLPNNRVLMRSKTMNLRVNNGVLEQMHEDTYRDASGKITDVTTTWLQVPQVELEQCYVCAGTGKSFTFDYEREKCITCEGTGEVNSEYGDNA